MVFGVANQEPLAPSLAVASLGIPAVLGLPPLQNDSLTIGILRDDPIVMAHAIVLGRIGLVFHCLDYERGDLATFHVDLNDPIGVAVRPAEHRSAEADLPVLPHLRGVFRSRIAEDVVDERSVFHGECLLDCRG